MLVRNCLHTNLKKWLSHAVFAVLVPEGQPAPDIHHIQPLPLIDGLFLITPAVQPDSGKR